MRQGNFSEFSYGYALTEELVYWSGSAIAAVPIFPSLREEGEEGGGFDLKLPQYGTFLYLQFKLSEYMLGRRNTKEVKRGRFKEPFYRIGIRSHKYSTQHDSLLKIEALGESVFYVAPVFHLSKQFTSYYLNGKIANESIFIPPYQIGKINDEKQHYVSFQKPNDTIYKLSEPVEIGTGIGFEEFTKIAFRFFSNRGSVALTNTTLQELIQNLISIIEELNLIGNNTNWNNLFGNRSQIQRVAYLAQIFFGCQVLIVTHKGRASTYQNRL